MSGRTKLEAGLGVMAGIAVIMGASLGLRAAAPAPALTAALLLVAAGHGILMLLVLLQARRSRRGAEKSSRNMSQELTGATKDASRRLFELRAAADEQLARARSAVSRCETTFAKEAEGVSKANAQLASRVEAMQSNLDGLGAGIGKMREQTRALHEYLESRSGDVLQVSRKAISKMERSTRGIVDLMRDLLDVELVALTSLEGLENTERGGKFLKQARRRREMAAENLAFRALQGESAIRELYLAEIFEGIEDVEIPIGSIQEDAALPNKVDMLFVVAIANHLNCRNVFEMGTNRGRTTHYLAETLPDASIVTLDMPVDGQEPAPHVGMFFKGTAIGDRITALVCDSRELDTGPYRGQMDLVFVDAGHSYELVENDTAKAFEMLVAGGVIVWHDYSPKTPGVVEFIRDFTRERPLFRVAQTSLMVHIDGVQPMTFEPRTPRIPLKRKSRQDPLVLP